MTFKNKLSCSTLTDDQHKRIIQNVEYLFFLCFDDKEELLKEYRWLIEFVTSLCTMGFICPREHEKYMVYIKEKYKESQERIKLENQKREGVGSEA